MNYLIDLQKKPITIIGGGGFSQKDLSLCLEKSAALISADGGANWIQDKNIQPNMILGDMDSVKKERAWEIKGTKIVEIMEQETTDFEKCLYSCNASVYLCLGFVGRRVDHFLSVCSSVAKYFKKKIVLIGSHDVIFHIPKKIEIDLPVGTRVSLFPLKEVNGIYSDGLKWSIKNIKFSPIKKTGVSNEAVKREVKIEVSRNGMLIILPKNCLSSVFKSMQI